MTNKKSWEWKPYSSWVLCFKNPEPLLPTFKRLNNFTSLFSKYFVFPVYFLTLKGEALLAAMCFVFYWFIFPQYFPLYFLTILFFPFIFLLLREAALWNWFPILFSYWFAISPISLLFCVSLFFLFSISLLFFFFFFLLWRYLFYAFLGQASFATCYKYFCIMGVTFKQKRFKGIPTVRWL